MTAELPGRKLRELVNRPTGRTREDMADAIFEAVLDGMPITEIHRRLQFSRQYLNQTFGQTVKQAQSVRAAREWAGSASEAVKMSHAALVVAEARLLEATHFVHAAREAYSDAVLLHEGITAGETIVTSVDYGCDDRFLVIAAVTRPGEQAVVLVGHRLRVNGTPSKQSGSRVELTRWQVVD